MQQNVVWWFEIYVSDMARAKAFYEAVFQRTERVDLSSAEMNMEMFGFPWSDTAPGTWWALVKADGYSPSSSGTIIYFVCEDCAVEESRVGAAGGKILQPKMNIGEFGFVSIIQDSEGNSIGLHSMN